MALIFADRVKETTTTQGTGAYLLSGALTACRTFSSVCSIGDTVGYCAVDVNSAGVATGAWEVGVGTFGSGNTLARTSIQASSNSNAAVSWTAGTRHIFLTVTAAQSSGRMRHIRKAADYTAAINDFVECNTSSGSFTVTLPALSTVTAGDRVEVQLFLGSNPVTVEGDGSDTINGVLNKTLTVVKERYRYTANSDLTDWIEN